MEYRKARCIELHDLRMELSVDGQGYYMGAQLLRTDERPAFKIRMEELKPLVEAFGFDLPRYADLSGISHQDSRRKDGLTPTSEMELNIYAHHSSGDNDFSCNIDAIECQVLAAHLLNIRISSRDSDGTPSIEEVTYSGTFTIWWMPNL